MREIREANWGGWNPSAGIKGDPNGQLQPALLQMDNLNQDEFGVTRIVKGPYQEASNVFNTGNINSIFSTIINNLKARFVYIDEGTNKKIMCTEGDITTFTKTIASQSETASKCAFINALGRVIMCAGAIQQKYDGTNNFALGIAKPPTPTAVVNNTYTKNLSNLDGSNHYTNWTSVVSSTFTNTGTYITGSGAAVASSLANNFTFQTIFAANQDTTNLNGAGKDEDNDIFQFTFNITDITQLAWVRIELYSDAAPPDGSDYWWKEWDFQFGNTDPSSPYAPFPISSNVDTSVQLKRKDWFVVGNPDWTKVKAVRVTIGITGSAVVIWQDFKVFGGADAALTGDFDYVVVYADNSNGWYEFSPASDIVSVTGLQNQSVTITPHKTTGVIDNLPANANEFWLFRRDTSGGLFFKVDIQTGAYAFQPAAYTDSNQLDDLITAAAVNSRYNLEFYRTALPTNIIDMIWFRDRIIYLVNEGFIPSFKLDPGSYDSRFKYELIGSAAANETCLFIAKLDVGTFIVATSSDFYRITGTFNNLIDPNDPTGQTIVQDVVITPLGIKYPSVSRAWVEYQGSILYVAADGIRTLFNATSSLINDNIDLLFRGETRYNLPPIRLLPRDGSIVAIASTGQRIYISLPHEDGINRLFILNIANQTNALNINTRSWRLMSFADSATNPISMCKEEDGNILYGGQSSNNNLVGGLEKDQTQSITFPIKFKTQFNYGGTPANRKDIMAFKCKIHTGGQNATLIVYGLQENGTITTATLTIVAGNNITLEIDLNGQFANPCVAFAVEISVSTTNFEIQWFEFIVEERPARTLRALFYENNFEIAARKRLGAWAVRLNPRGSIISLVVTADGNAQAAINLTGGDEILTFFYNPPNGLIAVNWGMELIVMAGTGMEFYEFMKPTFNQLFPVKTTYAIFPYSEFGKNGEKQLTVWGALLNTFGAEVTLQASVDGVTLGGSTGSTNDIGVILYQNTQDTNGSAWQLEVFGTTPFEFYKFLQPEFLQVFPTAKLLDQVGPLDFNKQAIVFGMRLRLKGSSAGQSIHYVVYDGDVALFASDITITDKDTIYLETFPKGINSSTCKVTLTSATSFLRYSIEFKIRVTGNETEEKFVMVSDVNAK